MTTRKLLSFETLTQEELSIITGGWSGLGDVLAGLLGGLAPSPTWEQLNGIKLPKPKSCSPYGVGGTPNSCNF